MAELCFEKWFKYLRTYAEIKIKSGDWSTRNLISIPNHNFNHHLCDANSPPPRSPQVLYLWSQANTFPAWDLVLIYQFLGIIEISHYTVPSSLLKGSSNCHCVRAKTSEWATGNRVPLYQNGSILWNYSPRGGECGSIFLLFKDVSFLICDRIMLKYWKEEFWVIISSLYLIIGM